jgi:hypothetical protein
VSAGRDKEMAKIVFSDRDRTDRRTISISRRVEITMDELNTLVAGSSIRWVKESIGECVFKTSDDFLVAITPNGDDLKIEVQNHGFLSHFRFNIPAAGSSPRAFTIERRIHALRQLYALFFLLIEGREEVLLAEPEYVDVDLEQTFLSEDDGLQISDIGIGSLWVTLRNWTEGGRKAIVWLAAILTDQGREALTRRLLAETRSKELAVRHQELTFEFDRANKTIELVNKIEKIKDPAVKERVIRIISRNAAQLETKIELSPMDEALKLDSPPKPKTK